MAIADTLPHRRKYLVLNLRLLEAHREWIEEVERELGADGRQPVPSPVLRLR